MRTLKFFVFLLAAWLMAAPCAFAAEYDAEADGRTGTFWRLDADNVTYEVSDETLAEVVRQDGKLMVKFRRPGDVYVITNSPAYGRYVYLIHITGDAVDETAVNRSNFAREVLALVNTEREKRGARPLALSDELMAGADIRARELPTLFSHTRPDGSSCFTVLKQKNRALAENIAAGAASPAAVVDMWMRSDGHRKNILNPSLRFLGVGYAYDEGSEYAHYWVQMFSS